MGTRTTDQGQQQVKLEMSHSSGGNGRHANLRIFEEKSGLMILNVEIPPEEFYKLLSGLVDGTTLPAHLLTGRVYQRVGRERHHWSRKIGYGVTQRDAETWAINIMDRLSLDTWAVNSRQGGLWAFWELWTNTTDQETLDAIRLMIETDPLPAGVR
jgi:hypothetical protein